MKWKMARRRFVRFALYIAAITALIYFIKSLLVPPSHRRIDLRKYGRNFHIISPYVEPRGYFEEDLFILVVVSSSPKKQENVERRNAIRRTWGKFDRTQKYKWKVVFMMGKDSSKHMNDRIMAEHEKYGDLLIGDYTDTYRNITTKLLMAFQWASRIKCNYILKTDSDVYIDIPKLIKWLIVQRDKNSFYGGVLYRGIVVRNTAHRHYVTKDDLSLDYYPQFCKGSMYVLSARLIPKMVDLSRQVTRIGPDDAYIGILADQLGISPVRIEGLLQKSYLHRFVYFISYCELRDLIGIGDSLTPSQVNYIHEVKYIKTAPRTGAFHSLCISVHMKFFLLLLFCFTCLLIFGYRRCNRRILK